MFNDATLRKIETDVQTAMMALFYGADSGELVTRYAREHGERLGRWIVRCAEIENAKHLSRQS